MKNTVNFSAMPAHASFLNENFCSWIFKNAYSSFCEIHPLPLHLEMRQKFNLSRKKASQALQILSTKRLAAFGKTLGLPKSVPFGNGKNGSYVDFSQVQNSINISKKMFGF